MTEKVGKKQAVHQPRPNCSQFEADLSAFVDGEQTVAHHDRVAAHIRSCEHCRTYVNAIAGLNRLGKARDAREVSQSNDPTQLWSVLTRQLAADATEKLKQIETALLAVPVGNPGRARLERKQRLVQSELRDLQNRIGDSGSPSSPPAGESDSAPSGDDKSLQFVNWIFGNSKEQDGDQELVLRIDIDEWAEVDEVSSSLSELIREISAYHVAFGGNGLVVDDWHFLTPETVPEGVRR